MSITIPPDGARLGRSSKNDIVLVDPLLSRHHCRLFFRTGGGLWVSDLGSANQTLLNGSPIQESALKAGDAIELGDTKLRVVNTDISGAAAMEKPEPHVDLGFARENQPAKSGPPIGKRPLLIVAALVLLAALAIWAPNLFRFEQDAEQPSAPVEQPEEFIFEVDYEKVKANTNNIFRYALTIDRDGKLSVQIDDLRNDRHVRKQATLDKEYASDLAESISNTGFLGLQDEYEGLQPDILEQWDLSVTVGKDTKRTVVRNRLEPPVFEEVRQMIEECARNELGIWALQYTSEELKEMAERAYLQGKKLYDEREVSIGNLAEAMEHLEEAELYLETVEPKPAFYKDLVVLLEDTSSQLDQKYENQNFRVQKALRLKNWEDAARELRILLKLIPDRNDPRHKRARKQLIEVERRLNLTD